MNHRFTSIRSVWAVFLVAAMLASSVGAYNVRPVYADKAGVCGTPGKDGPVTTLTGIVNSYYPGTANVAASATSIPVGAARAGGGPAIAAGDLLLVIQMQGADINATNTNNYGDGVGNNGTTVNTVTYSTIDPNYAGGNVAANFSAGQYEYVVATGPVAGGFVPISTGLVNPYYYSNNTSGASQGQRRFQVIRVPQYSNATVGAALSALRWDGSTGGVLVFDVAGQLNWNGQTINVSSLGFRGGGGRQLTGAAGYNWWDFRTPATAATNGSKGEGYAGTPRYVNDNGALVNTGVEGYPNGSNGRGGAGNGGGGSTDGNPALNEENSGGGGGGNGGYGGMGGNAWNSALVDGGYGGAPFPGSAPRLILGGGGGAGTTNNGTGTPGAGFASSGAAGGGVVFVRSGTIIGTGTINASGASANQTVLNDSGGGGGAGGSVVVIARNGAGSVGTLTVNATGGRGGDAWPAQPGPENRHGPGGGGGGGFVYTSGAVSGASSVAGGANGISTTANDAFGATAGGPGVLVTNVVPGDIPTSISGANCVPVALTTTKTTSTPTVTAGSTATYTITVSNAAGSGGASGATISDVLPTGFTYASTGTVTLNGNAVRTATSNPSAGAANPTWGTFLIPGGGSVAITFTVNVGSSVPSGTYQNPVTATYLDPVRTTTAGSLTSTYDPASSTGEDVTVAAATCTNGELARWNFENTTAVSTGTGTFSTNGISAPGYIAGVTGQAVSYSGWPTTAAVTDYVQFAVSTAGRGGIQLSFNDSRSNTGPTTLQVQYSTDGGTNFTQWPAATTYTVNTGWSTRTIDFGGIPALNNNPNAVFRIYAYSAAQNNVNATFRLDNVSFTSNCSSADLAVTKTNGTTSVNANGSTTYTLTLANNGPAAANNATLSDPAATGLTKTAIGTCTALGGAACPAVGAGAGQLNIANLEAGTVIVPTLPSGGSISFTVTANVTAGSGSVTNTFTTTPPSGVSDPTPGNNVASDTDTVAQVADLAVTKTNGTTTVSAGGTTTYTLTLTNNGPSAANNATLSDPAAVGLTKTAIGACTASAGAVCPTVGGAAGQMNIANLEAGTVVVPTLPSGGSITFTITASVTAVSGSVVNTFTAASPAGVNDPTPGNNSATDTDTVTPVADLLISKTNGVAAVNAGGVTSYTITVTNNGPSSVASAVLSDIAVPGLTKTGVACSATPGQCTVGTTPTVLQLESGAFSLPVLASGQSYQIVVTANVTAVNGNVVNSATIAPPPGTTNPGESCISGGAITRSFNPLTGVCTSTDTDTVTPIADLVVTKTDGVTAVSAGGTTTYTLTLTNNGPSPANNTSLQDGTAVGLTKTSIGACTASAGATCPTVGSGAGEMNIANLEAGTVIVPTLPNGGSITFTITANVTSSSGSVTNTFTATPPAGTTDPTPATASDTDTVVAIIANNDSGVVVNGTTGETSVGNVLVNDTLNGTPATLGNVILTQVSTTNPGVTLNPADASVNVAPGTPGGTYVVTYQICDKANPTICDTATVSVPVVVVDAVNDTGNAVNGITGGPSVADVLVNDTLNGAPATLDNVILTQVSTTNPGVTLNPINGSVNVAPGTPAGNYTVTYQICDKANPTFCDTATVTVPVNPPAIVANDDNYSATPVNGFTGGNAGNAFSNDTLNGAPVLPAQITATIVTQASNLGVSLNLTTGSVDVAAGTPAGTYTIDYRICENLNPTNCDTATITVTVDPPAIVANDDNYSATPVNGYTGGNVGNAFNNDTLNGASFLPSQITATILSQASNPGVTMDPATGSVDVAPGTPAGTYTIQYQVCEKLNPSNCDTATITVVVDPPTILANDDDYSGAPVNGLIGGNVGNAFDNDTLNGVSFLPSQITATILSQASNPGVAMNPATGSVDVAPGTPAGTYTIQYEICENLNPSNCDTATITVVVDPPAIVANNDNGGPVNGVTGATNVLNVLANDLLNGVPATLANVTLTRLPGGDPGLIMNPDGSVDVPPSTLAGTYSFDYQICDKLNPANCSTATATVVVDPSPSLTVQKNVTSTGPYMVDDVITYSIVVTNTGNVVLTNVLVSDPGLTPGSATCASVPMGGTCKLSGAHTVTQAEVNSGSFINTASVQDDNVCPAAGPSVCQDSATVNLVQTPSIGIAKRVVSTTEVTPGTWDVTYAFYVENNGTVTMSLVQVVDDLSVTFPLPTTFSVRSIASTEFTENTAYNGSSDINLLTGVDSLAPRASGTITLVVRIVPAKSGPFDNVATVSGMDPNENTLTDDSQNGTDPDPDNDGDPTNNDDPTPLNLGANLFDPPSGVKSFDASGLPVLKWTMIWINNSNIVAVNAQVSDPIASGTTFAGGLTCTTSGSSSTSQCSFEPVSAAYPQGRVIWSGSIGPDLGATDAASAANEVTISFNVTVGTGTNSVRNVATIDSDGNGDGDLTDAGEQITASASSTWTATARKDPSTSTLPATGFAPNVVTDLSHVPYESYLATGDVTLEIPSLGVKIPVVGVPKKNGAWNVSWLENQAGWLAGSAFPSWNGNSILTGHVYLANGLPGPFVSLYKLKYGDRIIIHAYGQKYIFAVQTNAVVTAGDTSVMKHEDKPWLTMVTCKDYDEKTGSYRNRVVVRAVLVRAEPE